ncbi:uncharacterized protein LOC127707488 [Mytilus californianus]|uniref:uncharacterized protein LOC127707488 n=1 Tax=Mytilus californianus TaxID=6549 RepID=UPI0022457592|nr:uncharacterized protein LOC127707488 [Mytilus californianus]
MASNCLNVLKAIFILPFTAGLVKERRTVGFSSHDGSISVCVLLTTTIAIIIELMNNYIHHDFPLRILIIALLCIGIITLIFCSVILSLCGTWRIEKEIKVSNRLKLFFLWIFCCGNIIYQVVDLVTEFECGVSSDLLLSSVYYILTWVFTIGQTIFIQCFSKYRFANKIGLYYGILLIFLTNISLWMSRNIDMYYEDVKKLRNETDPFCGNNTVFISNDAKHIFNSFLDPVLLEFCLLSLISLSELWPKQISHNTDNDLQESVVLSEEIGERELLLSGDTLNDIRTPWNLQSVTIVIIGLLCILILCIVISFYMFSERGKKLPLAIHNFFTCVAVLRILLIFICFYSLSVQLTPRTKNRKLMNMHHFIILTSSVATCAYYAVQRTIVFSTLRSIATVLQTIFILQMKHYRKVNLTNRFFSIQNVFLILSIDNLAVWIFYTFAYGHKYINLLYTPITFDVVTWIKYNHFWVPFVMFYHFECFILFYCHFSE